MEMKKNCWNMRRLSLFGCFTVVMLFVTVPGHADPLVNNGGNLIWDPDQNITWYNPVPTYMTWNQAMAWAAGLKVGGVTGWQLPSALNADGSGPIDGAYNVTGSEMGHLYYVELGNLAIYLPDGSLQPGGGLTNIGPFVNLQSNTYWSGTAIAATDEYGRRYAIAFGFEGGYQGDRTQDSSYLVLAVHSGDVTVPPNAVPEPAAIPLLGFGLIGLAGGLRRKFRGPFRGVGIITEGQIIPLTVNAQTPIFCS